MLAGTKNCEGNWSREILLQFTLEKHGCKQDNTPRSDEAEMSAALFRVGRLLVGAGVIPVGRIRLWLAARLHSCQGLQIILNLRPLRRVLLGSNRRIGIRIVSLDVALDPRRYRLRGLTRNAMEQIGVRRIGERIASRLHYIAGIQIAVRQRM